MKKVLIQWYNPALFVQIGDQVFVQRSTIVHVRGMATRIKIKTVDGSVYTVSGIYLRPALRQLEFSRRPQ